MVVAVTKGMENIEAGLKSMGYDVVLFGQYSLPVDAVVYYGSHLSSGEMTTSNFGGEGEGVLMINATNMTLKQINDCLSRKTYSPLF